MTDETSILVGDLLRNSGSELLGRCERCMLQVLVTEMRLWQRLSSFPQLSRNETQACSPTNSSALGRSPNKNSSLESYQAIKWCSDGQPGARRCSIGMAASGSCVHVWGEGPERAAQLSAKAEKLLFCCLVALCLPVTLQQESGSKD